MPDTLETDPKKGFVALPMSVFELDLTPGAFRTLAELCRMANLEGKCWPSLAQLGDRLGRSRAAISGYIAELRDAELIETETQKMANGYNYRLRYCVVFWQSWRKQLVQSSERSVKPVERPLKTKNHNHINQSPAQAGCDQLILDWKRCVGHAPYPVFDTWPSEALLAQSKPTMAPKPQNISVDIIEAYSAFLRKNGVSDGQLRPDVIALLRKALSYQHQATTFLKALEDKWQPHWSKPPTLPQLKRLLAALPPGNGSAVQAKLLASYLKRWEIHSSRLSLAAPASNVAA